MKQSIVLSILLLLLSSSSLVIPIHARNKAKSPSQSPIGSPAPGPSNSDCSTVVLSMLDCLSYISIGSNDTKPVKSCCGGIETVLEYNPQCICAGLVTSKEMGVDLNTTRALSMPKDCKLAIAPPHCGLITGATPGAATPGAVTPGAATPGAATPGAATPGASVPIMSPVSPSSGTPTTSPSSTNSPTTSPPSSTEPTSETAPTPSKSDTNNLSVPALTLVAVIGFSAFLINFSF